MKKQTNTSVKAASKAKSRTAASKNKGREEKRRPPAKAVGKSLAKPGASETKKGEVVLLSGGNPQIPKGDGDAPVQAYLAALPGWKQPLAKRVDELIVQTVPNVRKAVKWNSPFYGVEGLGWFLSYHAFTRYLKVTFFSGTALQPIPPGGTQPNARWIDIYENGLDEDQMVRWIKQAAKLPGWVM